VRSRTLLIGLLLAAAPFVAILGAVVGRTTIGSADFHFVVLVLVLALLFLLHRTQWRNNQAIEKKLDELIVRKERTPKKVP
jgi:low affinity Fe/Cu permease